MQISAKINNKSTPHSLLLKPRVGDVVIFEGKYYSNISGFNSVITDIANWFPLFKSESINSITVNKTAIDIIGADPDYKIDLTTAGFPMFPVALGVYVDLLGDNNYIGLDPVSYNPGTRNLSGMSSPIDFPNQKIKIIAL